MINQERSEKYATMCYMYGLTAILKILMDNDSVGDFDECQIILDALNGIDFFKQLGIIPQDYAFNKNSYFTEMLRLITGRDGIEIFNYLEKHIQVIKDYVK